MWEGLLPIGSVVRLIGSERNFMIVATCVIKDDEKKEVFDYAACIFPEGFTDSDNMFLFNRDQIDDIFCVGYMTEESEKWTEQNEKNIAGLRDGSISI